MATTEPQKVKGAGALLGQSVRRTRCLWVALRTTALASGLVFSMLFGGCKSDSTTTPAAGFSGQPRTFRMGFSPIPPRLDFAIALQSIDMWSTRADAAIISYEVPWDSLLAGVKAESLSIRYIVPLANYFRSKGHRLWVYVDPANGLNRAGEADPLVRHSRSFTEPDIQQLYRRWVVVVDSMVRPEHLGLALETNLIRGLSPLSLYTSIRQAVNAVASEIRARDSLVKLSVSVQVDYAWGMNGGTYQGIATDFADFPFVNELGLSSYPFLAGFATPEEVPMDYYSRLIEGHTIPVMVTEGGWTSTSLDSIISSQDEQRRYIARQVQLLERVRAIAVFQLTFTDLDLVANPPPPGSILPLFAHLGLVDVNLFQKTALTAWDSTYLRPLQ